MQPRVHNFNAGPAALPLPALQRAKDELLDFAGTNMSVLEHSHRGKEYEAVHEEAIALVRELVGVSASYDVLLLQGGASHQFAMIPLNFLPRGGHAGYVVTGVWSEKAIAEAKIVGDARLAASTEKDGTYVRVPTDDEIKVEAGAAYVHYTTNETIHGVQFHRLPQLGNAPVICDMSSDFLAAPVDISKYAMVYAGAQKNVGPSGLCVAILDKAFAKEARKDSPKILRYETHAAANSLYNTAPTFSVYLMRNVLLWLKEQGGAAGIAKVNEQKATELYACLDKHAGFYRAPVEVASRSQMNVVFRLPTEALENELVKVAEQHQMVGIKGHRSVGGLRVSLYNAVELGSVRALVGVLDEFARKNG